MILRRCFFLLFCNFKLTGEPGIDHQSIFNPCTQTIDLVQTTSPLLHLTWKIRAASLSLYNYGCRKNLLKNKEEYIFQAAYRNPRANIYRRIASLRTTNSITLISEIYTSPASDSDQSVSNWKPIRKIQLQSLASAANCDWQDLISDSAYRGPRRPSFIPPCQQITRRAFPH